MKVAPGDRLRIAARDYNAMLDAADSYRRSQLGTTNPIGFGLSPLLAKNTSGEDVQVGQVLGIDGPVFSQADNPAEFFHNIIMSASKPTTASHLGKWCVALETIPAGRLGRVAAWGIAAVSLQLDYADHPFADVANNSFVLKSNWCGAGQILWTQSSSPGLTYAIVRIGDLQAVRLRVTVTETDGIAAGSSGEVTIADTSPAQTLTAWLDWAEGGEKVSQGKEAFIEYFRTENKWRITGAECES
jgi:hypothetical protein